MLAVAMLVRWIGLGALACLVGGLGVDLLVLPGDAAELVPTRRRLRVWGLVCVVVVAITTGAELLLRARTLAGGDLGQAARAVPLVLSRTHFGAIWIARLVLIAALLVVAAVAARGARAVALTTALSGHAADWGDVTPSVFFDWLHVLAASLWIGGLAALTLAVFPAAPEATGGALTRACARFSRLAAWSLAVVALSGVYSAWVQLPDVAAFRDTPYGRVLLAKIAVVIALVALGATSRYTLLPRLAGTPARSVVARGVRRCQLAFFGPVRAPWSRLVTVVACEAALGAAVLGLTAVLGESTPARHAGHVSHVADVDAGQTPVHATMEQLHQAGGVPGGWMFRLPGGDAARGRAVFGRLECFRCHRIAGESYPRPSAPGP